MANQIDAHMRCSVGVGLKAAVDTASFQGRPADSKSAKPCQRQAHKQCILRHACLSVTACRCSGESGRYMMMPTQLCSDPGGPAVGRCVVAGMGSGTRSVSSLPMRQAEPVPAATVLKTGDATQERMPC